MKSISPLLSLVFLLFVKIVDSRLSLSFSTSLNLAIGAPNVVKQTKQAKNGTIEGNLLDTTALGHCEVSNQRREALCYTPILTPYADMAGHLAYSQITAAVLHSRFPRNIKIDMKVAKRHVIEKYPLQRYNNKHLAYLRTKSHRGEDRWLHFTLKVDDRIVGETTGNEWIGCIDMDIESCLEFGCDPQKTKPSMETYLSLRLFCWKLKKEPFKMIDRPPPPDKVNDHQMLANPAYDDPTDYGIANNESGDDDYTKIVGWRKCISEKTNAERCVPRVKKWACKKGVQRKLIKLVKKGVLRFCT